MTLNAIETLLSNAGDVSLRVVVWDNASSDGSADAIDQQFPAIEVIKSEENLGFAEANNRAAAHVRSDWLLLLNPDTETHPGAIETLLRFAKAHPEAGITGGRTVYPDGSLNPSSCWNRMTVWSLLCNALGLRRAFPNSSLFNPEGLGGWQRDTVRQVDIVVGCFLMISARLWQELRGFDRRYFMYGEESDLCLRAARLGYRPMITPDAQIMHLIGASTPKLADKVLLLMKAKATLVRDHWRPSMRPLGIALLWIWAANQRIASIVFNASEERRERSRIVWSERRDWLAGYE